MLRIIKYCLAGIVITTTISFSHLAEGQEYIIDTDFPGGNVIVTGIKSTSTKYFSHSGDTISLRPDLRDTKGNWFYWNFRITKTSGKTLHFQFPGNHIGSFGPAFSRNGGKTWNWLYKTSSTENKHFQYTFGENEQEVRFSSVFPYLQKDFSSFISSLDESQLINPGFLCKSGKGRYIEKLVIQNPHKKAKYKVLLTARHHACEAMANYTLEGIIEAIVKGEGNAMEWLRENVSFFIIPFMDKDGVEDGDQGKNRMPWDHLGDYSGQSIYNSTGALREQLPAWAQDQLKVALDLHCPGLRGSLHETIFIVEAGDPIVSEEQRAFLEILKDENRGILKLHPTKSIIEYGTGWNVSSGKSERMGFREWASDELGVPMAATLEIPYAINNGQMVTPHNAKVFGNDIAHAIAGYLQSP